MVKGTSAMVRNRRRMAQAIVEALESRQLLSGTEYVVNSLADTVAADNVLTLREAIQAANTDTAVNEAPAGSSSETDVIRFDPELFANGPATLRGHFWISGRLSIQGPGAGLLSIDGALQYQVFCVYSGATLDLSGVRLTRGHGNVGAALDNSGTVTMSNVVVSGNSASISGGGLCNDGTMTLTNVTVVDNYAEFEGGGVMNRGTLMLNNVTITGNNAYDGGGGVYISGSSANAKVTNSIIAQNAGSKNVDLFGTLASGSDYNLISRLESSQLASVGVHTLSGTLDLPLSPKLGDLTSINGQLVRPLLPGSPAINAGCNELAVDANGQSLLTDGAGNSRVVGGTVDMGAAERPVGLLGGFSVPEGTPTLALHVSGITSPSLTYQWDLDGDGIFGETGAGAARGDEVGTDPTFLAAGLDGPFEVPVSLRVLEGQTPVATDSTIIRILNVAPTLSMTTAGPVRSGESFTLNLSSSDPGDDTISRWWIRGTDFDGTTLQGNPSFVTRTYPRGGVYTVLANVTDEDGTYRITTTIDVIGRLMGHVFKDMDRNGVGDPSEAGLEGCRVFIDADNNGQLDESERSTLTDASGSYAFDRLDEGTYKLRVIPPAGWRATLGSDGLSGTAVVGNDTTGLDFGAAPAATISGTVFKDLNGNGTRESDEPGVSGQVVYIDLSDNGQLDPGEMSVTTDATGAYRFEGLVPGSYKLRQVLAGWQSTVDAITASVQDGLDLSGQDFAITHTPVTYVVQSLNDVVAADGVLTLREAIEASNTNAAVNEAPAGFPNDTDIIRFDPVLFTNGQAKITLGGSEFSISGALQIHGPGAGLLSIDANHLSRIFRIDASANVSLSGLTVTGGSAPHKYFERDSLFFGTETFGGGIYNAGTLIMDDVVVSGNSTSGDGHAGGDYMYNHGGGIFNAGTLRMTNGSIVDNTCCGTSDSLGMGGYVYNYGGGVYNSGTMALDHVDVQSNAVFCTTDPSNLPNQSLVMNDGGGIYNTGTLTMLNASVMGNSPNDLYGWDADQSDAGSISGTLFEDLDGNGTREESEPVLSGRTVYLDANGNAQLDAGEISTITDAGGVYRFENLVPGSYTIRQVLPAGWDATGTAGAIELAGGQELSGQDLGSRQRPAVTYVVQSLADTVADDGVLTFREAFEAANTNLAVGDAPAGSLSETDRITFAPGLGGSIAVNDLLLSVSGKLAIEGPGADQLTLQGSGWVSVIGIEAGAVVSISGIRISGGYADHGGGICNAGRLLLSSVIISGNFASYGGGIFNAGTLTVRDSTISDNAAWYDGGGVHNTSTLELSNVTISKNNAYNGGGVFNSATLTSTHVTIANNSAALPSDGEGPERPSAGGLYNSGTVALSDATISGNWVTDEYGASGGGVANFGTMTIERATILSNGVANVSGIHAGIWDGMGGGILNSGPLTITDTIIRDNSAAGADGEGRRGAGDGGGICDQGGMVTISNTTISGNKAASGGGISSAGTLSLTNVTILGNTAVGLALWSTTSGGRGGGVQSGGRLSMTNVTISGNTALGHDKHPGSGGGIATEQPAVLTNTIVAGNTAESDSDISGQLASGSGYNLIGGDAKLGPLTQINGRWVLPLLPGSPAINAGSNDLAMDAEGSPLLTDAAGNPRIVNGTVDIGAVERVVGLLGAFSLPEDSASLALHVCGTVSDSMMYLWDLDGDGVFGETGADAVRGDEVGPTPTFQAAGLDGPLDVPVGLRVLDGQILVAEDSSVIQILNVPPTLSITPAGDQPVRAGESFAINLSASDPGNDTISKWTIDWGDGQSETIEGNPSSATHIYQNGGEYRINASATDEDGTYSADPVDVAIVWAGGNITGTLFGDSNGNGVMDGTEQGRPGRTIYIDANDNGILDEGELSTVTDASGGYLFTRLAPGTYKVRQDVPANWMPTLGAAGLMVTVAEGQLLSGADFGTRLLTTIAGYVTEEVNGKQSPLVGWTVFLDADSDGVLDNGELYAITNDQGIFRFDGLLPGSYRVVEVVQAGWRAKSPGNITQVHSDDYRTPAFVNERELGSISGTLFEDLNGNGSREEGEPTLSGRTVYLDANGNAQLDAGEISTSTDASGSYRFENLAPGSYTLRQMLPAGWLAMGDGLAVNVAAGQETSGQDLPSLHAASISGFVYAEANGIQSPLAAWMVFLDANGNGALDNGELYAITNADGAYVFSDLLPGDYRVVALVQDGWKATSGSSVDLTLSSGSAATQNFVNQRQPEPIVTSSIQGIVFEDRDGDGAMGVGEPALANQIVFLDSDNDGQWDASEPRTLTDAAGQYRFENLAAGAYRLRAMSADGTITTPARELLLTSGADLAPMLLGIPAGQKLEAPKGQISGRVFWDRNANRKLDKKDKALGKWRVFIDADKDGVLDKGEESVLTDARGRFAFKSLPIGNYVVRVASKRGFRPMLTKSGRAIVKLRDGRMSQMCDFGQRR